METSNPAGEPSAFARYTERVIGSAEPAARRLRDGRAAGVLFLLLVGYGLAVVGAVGDGQAQLVQLAVISGWAVAALVCFLLPWRRLRAGWVGLVPAVVAIGSLGVGIGAFAGVLHAYLPAFVMVFGYLGLVARPVTIGYGAALAEFCLLFAATLGRQDQQFTVILVAVLASAVIGAGFSAMVAWIGLAEYRMAGLRAGAQTIARATSEASAATAIAELAGELCGADGAAVLLTESPGSTLMVMRGSTEAAESTHDVRIDVAREQSGNGVVLRAGSSLFIADARSSPVPSARLLAQHPVGSLLYLPIPGEGGVMGTVTLWWQRPIEELPPIAAELVETLPYLAGTALHRVRQVARMDTAVMKDPVTGVDNRRKFDLVLTEMPVAGTLLLFELEGYAESMATGGSAAGVEVLRAFAAALRRTVRDNDLVARIDDDKFGVILPAGSSSIASGIIMQRLQRVWSAPHGVTFSAGVAIREDHEPPSAAFTRAEADLYATKKLRTSWDG